MKLIPSHSLIPAHQCHVVHDGIGKGVVDEQLVGVVDVEVWLDTKAESGLAVGADLLGDRPLTRVIEE